MDSYFRQSTPAYPSLSHTGNAFGSSVMQRTLSDKTDYSTDSAGSLCSTSEYPSQTTPISAVDRTPFDSIEPYYVLSDTGDQDTGHFVGSAGSQYQDVGQQTTDCLEPASLPQLFESRQGDEVAASQATFSAQEHLRRNSNRRLRFTVISSEAVDQALRHLRRRNSTASDREAVQVVLQRYLAHHLRESSKNQAKNNTALHESACQLQLRIQGEEAYQICYYAILTVLATLREQLSGGNQAGQGSGRSASMPVERVSVGQRFTCQVPECRQKGFGRAADLDRHNKMAHLADDEKKKFFCDYKRCPRHELPFYRQDHFRDHLRDFHKEDLLRRGTKADDKWWKSRAPYAMYSDWWRCNRCLITRVNCKTDGWDCPRCSMHCETERQRYRLLSP